MEEKGKKSSISSKPKNNNSQKRLRININKKGQRGQRTNGKQNSSDTHPPSACVSSSRCPNTHYPAHCPLEATICHQGK